MSELNLILSRVQTPALVIDMDIVEANISAMFALLECNCDRWRPHIKTAKLARVIQRMIARGVRHFKCATTLELLTLCEAGAADVLIAYPLVGARLQRVMEIAEQYPQIKISGLVDDPRTLEGWKSPRLNAFIDMDPGMNRTGISQDNPDAILELARNIVSRGIPLLGLHYYDGHYRQPDLEERKRAAFIGYGKLLEIIAFLESSGMHVPEVVTSGTSTLPCSLAFAGFRNAKFTHRLSAGTVVYNDFTTLSQLPQDWGFKSAVTVLTTVVSHPAPGMITLDAGHKAVSADAGDPTCAIVGHPELTPLHPSEEHLPVQVAGDGCTPSLGTQLSLVPRHVCPTVNNFDHAIVIEAGRLSQEPVSARGREAPLR